VSNHGNVPAMTSFSVELVKALAWPVIALLIAVIFRQPLGQFLGTLGNRVSKLSLFKVELELLPAAAAVTTPLLDDIRSVTNSAAISDSSRAILEQVQSSEPADFSRIALGDGKEWLTSRLYIAAAMIERMRDVKVFVFVERVSATERRFVAVAAVRQLRWALAQRYPWLEAAWVAALLGALPPSYPPNAPALPSGARWLPDPASGSQSTPPKLIVSDTGAFEPRQARQLVAAFIASVQRPLPPGTAAADDEWVALDTKTQEKAQWVTRKLLASLLPEQAFDAWAPVSLDEPRAKRTRAVLRRAGPFVALIGGDREFVRLANRQALLEEIAGSLGEEQ
jgi:hypothetical protein